MKLNDIVYLKITPEIKDFCSNFDLESYDYIAAKLCNTTKYDNGEETYNFYLGDCHPYYSLYTVFTKDIENIVSYKYPIEGEVYNQNLIDSGDILRIDNSSYTIRTPKKVAEIKLCGAVIFTITETESFIKPTPEQIKNLHDAFCIDVELFD